MKNLKSLFILLIVVVFSCDNNDDQQTTPITPTDGFTISNVFYPTENAYITIDQLDANGDGFPDHYNFFFTDGRITDAFEDQGIGYPYAFSVNSTSNLAVIKVVPANNTSLASGTITAGNMYVGSSLSTSGSNFSQDSVTGYNIVQERLLEQKMG